jgi:hypothetical protein
VTPRDVQELIQETVETPMRETPEVTLEEIDGDELVVHVSVTPERPTDGSKLAGEVLAAIGSQAARRRVARGAPDPRAWRRS